MTPMKCEIRLFLVLLILFIYNIQYKYNILRETMFTRQLVD